jgi:hypothetical protein
MTPTAGSRGRRVDPQRLARGLARAFVIAGGLFWLAVVLAGPRAFTNTALAGPVKSAVWPLLAALVLLGVGWVYEHLAAVLLFNASMALVVWGVIFGWNAQAWATMAILLIAPMALAAALFFLAARDGESGDQAHD